MKIYKNQEIGKINLDESGILSITWKDKENLEMLIDWCGQQNLQDEVDFNNVRTTLHFDFISDWEFNFKSRAQLLGGPEITSFKFLTMPDEQYRIEMTFDYQPIGCIKLTCSDFRFVIE